MKTKSSPVKPAALAALLLGLAPALVAETPAKKRSQDGMGQSGHSSQQQSTQHSQNQEGNMTSQQRSVRVAPEDPRGRQASELLGMEVYGSGGEELGNVHDFIIDSQSGKIAHVVVASGGVLGIGANLRAVPIEACNMAPERLTLNVDQNKWEQAPLFTDAQIASLSQEKRAQEIYQFYGQKQPSRQSNAQFVLVTKLRGREVHSNNQQIGEIDEVIIQPQAKTAAALLDPEDDFAGTDQNYIVPLNKLQNINQDDTPLGTTLTSQDFSRAGQTSDSTWATPDGYLSSLYVWPVYATNTGMQSDSQDRNSMDGQSSQRRQQQMGSQASNMGKAPVEAVQRAVQSATPNETTQSVRVTAEENKLVLRGTVPSEDMKERIEQRAEDAAQGWDIESEIRVASAR